MKKYQYIVALACVLVGAAGFASIYATNQYQQRENELAKNQQILEDVQDDVEDEGEEIIFSQVVRNETEDPEPNVENPSQEQSQEKETDVEVVEVEVAEERPVANITEEALHFTPEKGVVWPIEGSVLLDYSMDSTIFFPTLQQYQYNPAMVLSGAVNDKVYFVARGKITNIETNEVTGCTVTQDIGDGYTAIYGQLKELNFEVGEMVESGQVVGYVSEPTKYYAVEGSNVYFQLLKDGMPIDPEEILP